MIQFAILDSNAKIPSRKHPTDAGVDVYATDDGIVWPLSDKVFHTGVTFKIPNGYMFQAWPKSRHHHLVGAGILDCGYQGEVLIKVVNYGVLPIQIKAGDPLAQLVLVPVCSEALEQVALADLHAERTARGTTGGIVGQ